MSTTAAPLAGPLAPGLSPRPAWRIRAFVGRQGVPSQVCLRVSAGLAKTPEEALDIARKKFGDAMRMLPHATWRAFPVTESEPRIL